MNETANVIPAPSVIVESKKKDKKSEEDIPYVSQLGLEKEAIWKKSTLSLQERYDIIRSVGEECIQEEGLQKLLEFKDHPICYDGFEPSGK